MLFTILNFFFTVIIVILFVRYFVEKYRFYGFGPIMVSVVTLTERLIRPLKQIAPKGAHRLEENMPLAAIGVILVIRGLAIWALGSGPLDAAAFIHQQNSGGVSILSAMALSFSQGILLVVELLIAFLFASVMVSRRGISMSGNAGFMCFQERTFAVFRWTQQYFKSNNLMSLFLASSSLALIAGSVLASLFSLTFFYGSSFFYMTFIAYLFDVLLALLYVYWMVLLLAILSSWIGADQFSIVVQIVRAMADPYLNIFRRWMPWARIDFIDLSPIFAFLCLNPGLVYLLMWMQQMVFQNLRGSIQWI
ncbi:MAG: YggT family protein [Candidatus Omnitrophica bacterium]|nr:YggT family protein [Candidatus Omnitrophota bacterium]